MRNYLDGGDAILQGYRALGLEYIFSSPGSEWGSVWEALARQKVNNTPGPQYLSCWHETLAVDMAIGFTMATGRMQAVMLHAGVGLLQGSMGIQSALIQNIPMLLLSGESLTYGEQQGFDPGQQWYQNLSVVGGPHRYVEPLTKWSSQAPSIETLYESVVRGGMMAQRNPAGPVYLNVPIETQLKEWKAPARLGTAPNYVPPRAPAAEIEKVAALLAGAKNPVITTEGAGRSPQSYAALGRLARALAIPVVETPSSVYASFPKSDPLHGGPTIKPYFDSADVVLVIRSRVPWYPPAERPPNATVVVIDENPYKPHMVYQNLGADMLLEGDVAYTLETLADSAEAAKGAKSKVAGRLEKHTAAHAERTKARLAAVGSAKKKRPIDPVWLLAAMGEALPADMVYVDETVTHRGPVETHLMNQGPGSFYKVRGGLGQGLGHAIGVKLADKTRDVACLIGDGTFLYNPVVQSLGYSAQAGLPILIVVFNNNEYLAMRKNHEEYYPDGVAKQINLFYGAPVGGPDYSLLGAPFGAWGKMVDDPAQLVPALKEALAATRDGRTAILNVVLSH